MISSDGFGGVGEGHVFKIHKPDVAVRDGHVEEQAARAGEPLRVVGDEKTDAPRAPGLRVGQPFVGEAALDHLGRGRRGIHDMDFRPDDLTDGGGEHGIVRAAEHKAVGCGRLLKQRLKVA